MSGHVDFTFILNCCEVSEPFLYEELKGEGDDRVLSNNHVSRLTVDDVNAALHDSGTPHLSSL